MATKNAPASRLVFSVTQGGADTFAEAEIETGLSAIGIGANLALKVLEVGLQVFFPSAEADSYIEVALTRKTMAAVPALNERSLVHKISRKYNITTSGAVYVPDNVSRWTPPQDSPVLIVENPIYVCVGSSATGAANVAYGYILYELVKVTETERLQLLAQYGGQ